MLHLSYIKYIFDIYFSILRGMKLEYGWTYTINQLILEDTYHLHQTIHTTVKGIYLHICKKNLRHSGEQHCQEKTPRTIKRDPVEARIPNAYNRKGNTIRTEHSPRRTQTSQTEKSRK